MPVTVTQPIAGVSVGRETEVEVIYPSVAATPLGKLIGGVMGLAASVPTVPLRLLVSVMLGIPVAPVGVLAYGLSKVFGDCFVLTNRSVRSQSILGGRPGKKVSLEEIAAIEIESGSGYQFHRVGDLVLLDNSGQRILTLPAISYPERLRQVILDTRSARILSDRSLAHIQARKV